jgi:hypothetical protein
LHLSLLFSGSLQTAQGKISSLEQKLAEATKAHEIAETKAQGYAIFKRVCRGLSPPAKLPKKMHPDRKSCG